MSNVRESETLIQFLTSLSSGVKYAIERNVESIYRPLVGDIDILMCEKDFSLFIQLAKEADILISVTKSYGGARVFIGSNEETIKRIDCVWKLHYRGILLASMEEFLDRRVIDPETGLYILPDELQAHVVSIVKNAYGGADKYQKLLERNGFFVFNPKERLWWLSTAIMRHPIDFITGFIKYIFSYLTRLFSPTGLLVYGVPVDRLCSSIAIRYLYQDRIRGVSSLPLAVLRARFFSEVCVVPYGWLAQLSLSPDYSTSDCEREIIKYLRSKHK